MAQQQTGWTCPKCGRGVRPDVQTCDHGGAAAGLGVCPQYVPCVPYTWPTVPPAGPVWRDNWVGGTTT